MRIYTIFSTSLICLFSFVNAVSLQAQFNTEDVLTLEAFLNVNKISAGDEFKIGVQITLQGDWHVNSHKPNEEFLIPTVLSMDSIETFTLGEVNYPPGEEVKFSFSETPLSVYEGEALIWLMAKASPNLEPGAVTLTGKLGYQACNDVSCLIPTKKSFEIQAEVVAAGAPVHPVNKAKFDAAAVQLGQLQGQRDGNEIGALISGSGMILALVFIFAGGLALNLTPCVYPIIPITISFFVGQASGKMSKSFILALLYVLGMAITYSALGVTAALTGGLLGASLQNQWVLIAIAAVFLVFAASMFGAFEIRVPAFLSRMAGGSRQGAIGSLLMGLTVGIVAAPCIGPFVLSLLTYVAAQGDAVLGFVLFFVLSLGLGLPYLILGTFSGSIQKLPRSGEWMVWIKKVFGVIMIAVAIYFLNTMLPDLAYIILLTATMVLGGIFVGFLDKSKAGFRTFHLIKKSAGVVLIIFGLWTSASAWADANAPKIDWQPYSEELMAEAQASGKPIIIDFFADWCVPCRQLDKTLFSEPEVVAASEEFLALKADLTEEDSESVTNLRLQYNVRGVPTVILINERGREYRRYSDELLGIAPQEFVEIMNQAVSANGR